MPVLRQVSPRSVEMATWPISLSEYPWPTATRTSGRAWAKSTLVAMDQLVGIDGSARSRSVWTKPQTSPTAETSVPPSAARSMIAHSSTPSARTPTVNFSTGSATRWPAWSSPISSPCESHCVSSSVPQTVAPVPHMMRSESCGSIARASIIHPCLTAYAGPWSVPLNVSQGLPRDVHVEPVGAVLAFGEVPADRPSRAGVGGPEEDFVGPPVVARDRHDRARVLAVDGDAAETGDHTARVVGRGDIGPLTGLGGEPHDLAAVARSGRSVAGARVVAGGDVQVSVGVVHCGLVGEGAVPVDFAERFGGAGHGLPGRPAVFGDVERVGRVGDAHVDLAADLVEVDPGHALVVTEDDVARLDDEIAGVGEVRYRGPGAAVVLGTPQAVPVGGAEVQLGVVGRVHHQPLAHAAGVQLPPCLNGSSAMPQVSPRSSEYRTAPLLGSQSFV